jgi:hypothetical protein
MRRESSTVVVVVGEFGDGLLAGLTQSPNVSVARAPDDAAGQPASGETAAGQRPGWEAGALALREAMRRRSTYVVVPDDPLAEVAAAWRAMWELPGASDGSGGPGGTGGPGGPGAAARFEERAAEALAAWRDKRFELPDYYLVVVPPLQAAASPDMYLGPLRAVRPRRVAVAGVAESAGQAGQLLDTLRSLQHGPWWPPLDELLDAARHFYAGGLAETQRALA